jgi:hypothetical protein
LVDGDAAIAGALANAPVSETVAASMAAPTHVLMIVPSS